MIDSVGALKFEFLLQLKSSKPKTGPTSRSQWALFPLLEMLNKNKCDALRDLVPFVQSKKREKHPWKSVTFSKVAGFT